VMPKQLLKSLYCVLGDGIYAGDVGDWGNQGIDITSFDVIIV